MKEIHIVFQVLNFLHNEGAKNLTPIEQLLLLTLASHKGKKGICPSIPRLCQETNLTKWPVQRALKTLETKNLISINKSAGRKSSYLLSIPCTTSSSPATGSSHATSSSPATGVVAHQLQSGSSPATRYNKEVTKINSGLGVSPFSEQKPLVQKYTKKSYIFTDEDYAAAKKQNFHLQPCFNKFIALISKKQGHDEFVVKDWIAWRSKEMNMQKAKRVSPEEYEGKQRGNGLKSVSEFFK